MQRINEITGQIVDAAYGIHSGLGPGLLESVYEAVLARDLARRGLSTGRQKVIIFDFDGMRFEEVLRVDLLIQGFVVVELKSIEELAPLHMKQVLTYLRLLHLPVGLLINFGGARFRDNVRRIVNDREPNAHLRLDADTNRH